MGKHYWLHRISQEWDVAYYLFDHGDPDRNGYLSIGWVYAENQQAFQQTASTTEDYDQALKTSGYTLDRGRWSLYHFWKFQKGDIVVVPKFDRKFAIVEITDSPMPIHELQGFTDFKSADHTDHIIRDRKNKLIRYSHQKNVIGADGKAGDDEPVDIGFVVPMKILKDNLNRYDYADGALTSRMKIRQTTADIQELANNVEAVLQANGPIDLYRITAGKLSEVLLKDILKQLNDTKWEKLIRWYFEKIGATRAWIPAKNESGKKDGADADIVADFDPIHLRIYVQAKFYHWTTDRQALDQVDKYKEQHEESADFSDLTTESWAITSGDKFDEESVRIARQNHITLITGIDFARMLVDAGIADINDAFH